MVPGYENFEVCDEIPKDASLEFCEPDEALDDLFDYSCSVWAEEEEPSKKKESPDFYRKAYFDLVKDHEEEDYDDPSWIYEDVCKYRSPAMKKKLAQNNLLESQEEEKKAPADETGLSIKD